MKLSISARLVLLVALLVTATAGTISYYLYKSGITILAEHGLNDLSHNLQRDGDRLTNHINELKRDVLFLSNSPPIPGLMRAQKNKGYDPIGQSSSRLWQQRLTSLFTTLLSTNPNYLQVRWLDARGNEVIKVIRDQDRVVLTPAKALQNKAKTAYFKASTQLSAGVTHISPINLNREFGKISLPHIPVLRCTTPVFRDGKLFGVIIINLNFSHLLTELENAYSSEEQTLYVTNHHGAYLSHPEPDKRFAFELGHHFRIQEDFPVLAGLFAPGNQEQGRNIIPDNPDKNILVFVKIPFDTSYPDRFIAIGLTRSYAQVISEETAVLEKNSMIVSLMVVLSILLAAAFGNILVRPLKQIASNLDGLTMGNKPALPVKRTDEIGSLARALEDMADNVFASHQKLRALNNQLEDKVEERTQQVHQHLQLVNTINEAQTSFISSTDPQAAFQYLLNKLVELTGSELGFIAEVRQQNDGTPYSKTYAFTGISRDDDFYQQHQQDIDQGLEFHKLQNLFGNVLTSGKPVLCNDPVSDQRSGGLPLGHPTINNFAGLPIYVGKELLGHVGLANRQTGYHDDIIEMAQPYLTTFANLIASLKTRHAAQQKDLELQQTRADLQRAIQSSTAVFYAARASGDFGATFISENITNQLGYTPDDFINDPTFWAEHIHPEDKQRVFDELTKIFERGKHSHSYRFLNNEGHYRWMQDEVHLQFDENGKPKEMAGFWTDITERKQAELALSQREREISTILENLPFMLFIKDVDELRFVRFNRAGEELLGLPRETFIGKNDYDFFAKEQADFFTAKDREVIANGQTIDIPEEPIDTPHGKRILHTRKTVITDEHGKPTHLVGVSEDITDRKQIEQALAESEKKFRSVINSSPMGIFVYQLHDDQLIFSDYNPAANTILGVDCSQFIGKSIEQAFPNLANTEVPEHYRRAARDGTPWHSEDIFYDDHQNITGAYDVYAFQTAPETMAVMFLDVTVRQKAQEDLSRFKSTLDQTQDCVFMFSPETLQYFYANQGAMFLVGYSQEELCQLQPYDINARLKSEEDFREFIKPLLDGSQLSFTFETEYRSKDQKLIPVEVVLQYISSEDQAPRFVAMVRDITERKKIDRMKNEFVSTVSHELRTPLTSIRGSLGLLSGGAVGELPDKMQEMLHIASNNTDRLLLLINDILDMQKIESGQMAFSFNPIDVMGLVEQAVRDNTAYAEQHNVQFTISHRKDGVRVLGDHDRLMQVLGNLMSNAAKFSPAGETIELAVAQHNNAIRISVTDHGPGIPEAFQPKLFERFTQSDASDTRQKGGTGLGLSITKAIVQKHGGRIHYITRQGLGTTMFVELPLTRSTGPSQQGIIPGHLQAEHKPCILIIEDDPDIANLLQQLLSGAGYNCDIAYTAAEARKLLSLHVEHYKAITLDIKLPDTDGVALIEELRSSPLTQSLPIVVVSVEADTARRRLNGGAIGIIDWLNKPIDEQRLISALESVCKSGKNPNILHVEDEPDIHHIVKSLMAGRATLSWAQNLQEAHDMLNKAHFELILLDIALPDGLGLSLLSEIEQQHPTTKLVIYSAYDVAPEYLQQVHAVLSKSNTDNDKLLSTIESLLNIN